MRAHDLLALVSGQHLFAKNQFMERPDADRLLHRSHLFTVRMWREALGEGRAEWRLRVQHVLSGERCYFRDWHKFEVYLQQKALEAEEQEGDS